MSQMILRQEVDRFLRGLGKKYLQEGDIISFRPIPEGHHLQIIITKASGGHRTFTSSSKQKDIKFLAEVTVFQNGKEAALLKGVVFFLSELHTRKERLEITQIVDEQEKSPPVMFFRVVAI